MPQVAIVAYGRAITCSAAPRRRMLRGRRAGIVRKKPSGVCMRANRVAGSSTVVQRCDAESLGDSARNAPRRLRSPPARSSRCCRPDVRRARRAACASSRPICIAASAGKSAGSRRHVMSGSRRTVPRPEHGASTRRGRNAGRTAADRRRNLDDPHVGDAASGHGARAERAFGGAARRSRPRVRSRRPAPPAPQSCRRATHTRRARAHRRRRCDELRDQLRRFVLHDAAPGAKRATMRARVRRPRRAVRRDRSSRRLDALPRQQLRQPISAIDPEPVGGEPSAPVARC